jgi:ATP-dependent helicase/nuclease subunit A
LSPILAGGSLLPAEIAPESKCKTQKKAGIFKRQMRLVVSGRKRPALLTELLETWDFGPDFTQKWWASDTATRKRIAREIGDLHQTFRTNVVGPFLAAWRQYIYRLSVTLLTKARGSAALARQRANTLNYDDLLQLTARVLRGNADVRRALREKYRWLFVDEFQDTDPVQAEIIFLSCR